MVSRRILKTLISLHFARYLISWGLHYLVKQLRSQSSEFAAVELSLDLRSDRRGGSGWLRGY